MVNKHWATSQAKGKPSLSPTVGLVLQVRFNYYHLVKNTVQDGHGTCVSDIHQNARVSAYIFGAHFKCTTATRKQCFCCY